MSSSRSVELIRFIPCSPAQTAVSRDPEPHQGHTYFLCGTDEGTHDDHAASILRTIRAHTPAGTRVLVIDAVVQPGNDPQGAKWLDLLMLTLAGGRERDEAQWRALLDRAGIVTVRVEDGLIEATCR